VCENVQGQEQYKIIIKLRLRIMHRVV